MPTKRQISNSRLSKSPAMVTPDELPEFGTNLVPRKEKTMPVWVWPLIGIVIVGLITYAFLFNLRMFSGEAGYQAVFLTNGQVYFGKLVKESPRYLYLDDVYYIQVQEQIQPATTEGGQPTSVSVPTLMKRGSELHQPTGNMRINRDQVVAIENVGEESQLMKQITQLNSGN